MPEITITENNEPVTIYGTERRLHGQLRLSAPADTALTTANTYVKIAGTMTDGNASGFTVTDNKLVYSGPTGVCFLFNGASDVSVDKACELTYGLIIDGVLQEASQTPHTFPASARTQTMSITAILALTNGDEIDVYVKSSVINTTVSVKNLNITFWG